jgi:hypothetical protein
VDGSAVKPYAAGVDDHEPLAETYLARLNGREEEHRCHQKM